jgi:two-component system cell cycle sensor histidine kinase/response regulator CckA
VYGLISKIGGYITVDSSPGMGTVFTIDLPRIEAPLDGDLVLDDLPSTLQGNETILVAEDETQVREFVVEILRDVGYGVLSASSGMEAWNTLQHSPVPIDLLLSDLLMPALNGMDLREPTLVENPHLRLLVMSASSHEKFIVWVEEKGWRLRPTPFGTDHVLLAVRDVWDR